MRSVAAKEIRVLRCSSVVSAFACSGATGKFFATPRLCVETNQRKIFRHLTPALSPFEAEREKFIEREDGFGYQALTEFTENFYAS
jgi:hypothetical protein